MDLGLQGRRALVTGGTRGIGAAVADALRERGWKVVTLSRNGGDLQADVARATLKELQSSSRRAGHETGQDG